MLEEHLGVKPYRRDLRHLAPGDPGATSGPNADQPCSPRYEPPPRPMAPGKGWSVGTADLDTIRAHLGRAAPRRAQPALVVVSGDPGVGKSRLVAEIARATSARNERRRGDQPVLSGAHREAGAVPRGRVAANSGNQRLRAPHSNPRGAPRSSGWSRGRHRRIEALPITHAPPPAATARWSTLAAAPVLPGFVPQAVHSRRAADSCSCSTILHWCDHGTVALGLVPASQPSERAPHSFVPSPTGAHRAHWRSKTAI